VIDQQNVLSKLLEDSYQMSHFHNKKADYIREPEFHTANNVHGLYYDVGGNAASAFQFYATDSVHHFLRGALYFDTTPNADSLKPVNEFLREDIMHIVNSLKWTR
jgi:gliding motility-associated lipoprotein GldD